MFQKFFTNTIESKFIKYLLSKTPLPLYPTISDGDYMVKDCIYIYRTSIIKCKKSGYIYNSATKAPTANAQLVVGNNLIVGAGYNYGDYEVVAPYTFGENTLQITEKIKSNVSYYDPDTHYYLGKYLRCYRDIYGIDLMPFYNCFNYKIFTDFYLYKGDPEDTVNVNGYIKEKNSKYKLIAIPIKYNKTYTIAIDCAFPVLMKSVLYGNLGMVQDTGYSGYLTDYLYEGVKNINGEKSLIKVKSVNSLNYLKPITYCCKNTKTEARNRLLQDYPENYITDTMIEEDLKLYQNKEKYLYLVIQLPVSNKSSITVLEGDYTKTYNTSKLNGEDIESLGDKEVNKILLSKLSLLMINTKNVYAFSDRLIEYLLLNVIDYQDEISKNTLRAQTYMNLLTKTDIQPGVFDVKTRYYLFKKYMEENDNIGYDITGFVDKDMEKFITRGYDV